MAYNSTAGFQKSYVAILAKPQASVNDAFSHLKNNSVQSFLPDTNEAN
jgi:hypothetical protein